jgi:TetR/AcrR family transcriptional regulator, cholesterol catabolism regulator
MPAKKATTQSRSRTPGAGANGAGRATRRRDAEVIEAATQLFYERGYTETSVQDVAEALGMLKGSLYYYIDTKEDLLFRVFEEVHEGYDAHLVEWSGRTDLPPLERLSGYLSRVIMDLMSNLAKMSVYYHDMDRLSPERHATILRGRRVHMKFVVGLIEDAQAAGDADPKADARLLANFAFGAVIWTYRWYRPGGDFRRDAIASSCVEFVLNGIRGSAGS